VTFKTTVGKGPKIQISTRAHMGSRNRAVGSQWLVLDLPSLPLLSGKLRW